MVSCNPAADDDNVGTFSWSDLPYQGDYVMEDIPMFRLSPPAPPPLSLLRDDDEEDDDDDDDDDYSDDDVIDSCYASPTSCVQKNLSNCSPKQKIRKKKAATATAGVSFADTLQVRTYEVILGDHPCCPGGMALQCGWSYTETELIDLEVHERRSRHRRLEELRVGICSRRQRLRELTRKTWRELLQLEQSYLLQKQQHLSKEEEPVLHRVPGMVVCDGGS